MPTMWHSRRGNTSFTTIIFIGSLLSSAILFISFYIAQINFDQNCNGHLKRAADANTVELATKELQEAVDFLEKENMTSGYTSLFERLQTPDEDIGFWYQNLTASLQELKNMSEETAPLERSNMLMKLRETLLDDTEKGTKVTSPEGISRYPYNWEYAIWACLNIFGFFLSLMGNTYHLNRNRRKRLY